MLTEPVGQIAAADPAGGEIEHEALLFIDRGIDLGSVKNQEGFHGSMPRALVAVDKRVTANRAKHSAAAFSINAGYRSVPPNVALGWAMADSSAAKSRNPGAPPVAPRTRR